MLKKNRENGIDTVIKTNRNTSDRERSLFSPIRTPEPRLGVNHVNTSMYYYQVWVKDVSTRVNQSNWSIREESLKRKAHNSYCLPNVLADGNATY